MKKICICFVIAALAGCSAPVSKRETYDLINAEMTKAATPVKTNPAQPEAVSAALLPPITLTMPKPRQPQEERFSLAFNSVPAQQFFMSLVTGTRYSMLVHPDVSGVISANLKNVTIFEALDAIREQYGYDYKVEGTRIYIKPLGMQTRVFQVNYLTASRKGTSEVRVLSSSLSDAPPPNAGGATTASTAKSVLDSSNVSTTSNTDFGAS